MIVNFICQLDWAMMPKYLTDISLDVSVKMFFCLDLHLNLWTLCKANSSP